MTGYKEYITAGYKAPSEAVGYAMQNRWLVMSRLHMCAVGWPWCCGSHVTIHAHECLRDQDRWRAIDS